MKKILATILGLATGATLVHAQGYLNLVSAGAGVTTNTGSLSVPGTSGKTSTGNLAPFAYQYALLFIPNSAAPTAGDTSSPDGSDWVQLYTDVSGSAGVALTLTNYTTQFGGIEGSGGTGNIQAIGAGNQAYANGSSYYTMLVGWSSNLGTSWTTVSQELSSGVWQAAGYFGFEQGVSASPASSTPGTALGTLGFANNSLVLYAVPVPEPTTLALAGLGGISMLFLRRRKA
jgi:hypothetical protein